MSMQIASLSSAFTWAQGSVSLWAKYLDTSVWSDGSTRWWFKAVAPQAKEFLYLRKSFQANMVSMWMRVNSADFAYSGTIGGELGAEWFHVGVRWDCGQGKLWMYVKGAQRRYWDTVGTPVDATGFRSGNDDAVVGAGFYVNPAEEHNGWLAHVALWDTCLSADELLALAEV
jgi:hypothetical protein